MPVFNPAIPLPTDQLSVSQGDLLANFQTLGPIAGNGNPASNAIFQGGVLDASGFQWIYLPAGVAGTPPSGSGFVAGQIAMYGQLNATTTLNELYINKTLNLPAAATVVQIPITAFGNTNISGAPQTAASWTYLPSGQLEIGGKVTGTGNITITFNNTGANGVTGFPGFQNYITSIQATRVDNTHPANFACVATYSLTGCQVTLSNGSNGTIFWTARGI